MSSGLMFDYIIMNILRNKKLECHDKEYDYFFTNIYNKSIYMYMESLQDSCGKNGAHSCLDVPCVACWHWTYVNIKIILTSMQKVDNGVPVQSQLNCREFRVLRTTGNIET